MYETLMETAVTDENYAQALAAVKRNRGAAGIDRMTTAQLDSHLQANWWILKDKLLKGSYVPSPVRRVEIPKPSGGTRMLGIPTVQDRFIQQLLLQALTPIWDPSFSEHSYGFRPGRSAQDAIRAAQRYAQEGKDWVVDLDITKFFDHVNHDILLGRIGKVIRDKRVLHLIGKYLRRGAMANGLVEASVEGTPQGGPFTPRTQKITSNSRGQRGTGISEVHLDRCLEELYIYVRWPARATPRRRSASTWRGTCCGSRAASLRRSTNWPDHAPSLLARHIDIFTRPSGSRGQCQWSRRKSLSLSSFRKISSSASVDMSSDAALR
jgi:group II intron reverse transcriptase/maturase